jgi:hypothetical protein
MPSRQGLSIGQLGQRLVHPVQDQPGVRVGLAWVAIAHEDAQVVEVPLIHGPQRTSPQIDRSTLLADLEKLA